MLTKSALVLLTIVFLTLAAGCGGGSSQPPPPTVTVSVTPSSANLLQGATQSFSASVANTTNTSVTWSIQEGAAGGVIDATGKYTAPNAAGTFHVIATSSADLTRTAVATVTVPEVTVAVTPASGSFLQGQSQQFAASVTGHANAAVTWSLQEGTAGGVIDGTGKYTAPNAAGTFHVLATSQGNPSKSGSAPANVSEVVVTITPGAVAAVKGDSVPFTASVSGSVNTGVTWSLQSSNTFPQETVPGSVTSVGRYTAPMLAPFVPGTFVTNQVTATAQGNPARSASATVTVVQQSSDLDVTFTAPANVYQSSVTDILISSFISSDFTCSVQEGSAGGTILDHCRYLANASPGTYHVVATPTIDPARSASTTITVLPLTSFTLDPAQEILGPGLQRTILARGPDGKPNLSVSWTVNGGSIRALDLNDGTLPYSYSSPMILGDYTLTASAYPGITASIKLTVANSGYFSPGPPRVVAPAYSGAWAQSAIPLPNGQILILSQCARPLDLPGCSHLYDPVSRSFTSKELWFEPEGTVTLLANGKILVAAGLTQFQVGSPSRQAWIWDLNGALWPTAVGNLLTPRAGHTATLLPDGRVLIAGGRSGNYSFGIGTPMAGVAEIYDPATGTFTATGSLLQPRFGHSATLLPNGKVLIAFGTAGYGTNGVPSLATSAELYDPASGTFSATGPPVVPRGDFSATQLPNGAILFAGGYGSAGPYAPGATLSSVELYDPSSGKFSLVGSLLNSRQDFAAALLLNGKLLVQGGEQQVEQGAKFLRSAELFDPSTGTSAATGGSELSGGVLVPLPDGTVMLAGPACYSVTSCPTPTEIYHP